jgi:hypothetical protein
MPPPLIDRSTRQGALAVLKTSNVTVVSTLFLPGMLVRVASQLLAGSLAGFRVGHREMLSELGGEVEFEDKDGRWTLLFCATVVGPLLIGSALLFPMVVRSTLLDVRPFVSIAVDPSTVAGQGTPVAPFYEALSRYGTLEFLRLWFGISCFYCCVPSAAVLAGARRENAGRGRFSPVRVALAAAISFFRFLVAIDSLLLAGFAGAYLASGLLFLLIGWRLLGLLARFALGA